MALPYPVITRIPVTPKPPAVPSLWNDRYDEIDANFAAVSGDLSAHETAVDPHAQYWNDARGNSALNTKLPPGTLLCVVGATAALPGTVVADGSLISRSGSAAALWTFVEAHCRLVSEAAWVASDWGTYSTGDGASTFRLPRLTDEFLRYVGVGGSRTVGSRQLGSPIVGEDGSGYTLWSGLMSGQRPSLYDVPTDSYAGFTVLWDMPTSITSLVYPAASASVGIARPRNVAVLPLISLGA